MRLKAARDCLEVEKQRNFVESVLDHSTIGFWDWNISENTSYLSPALKRILGYDDHDLSNDPDTWLSLLFPQEIPRVVELVEQSLRSHGRIPLSCEIQFRHKNNSIVWIFCSGSIIEWDERGDPRRLVGCHMDITERKKVEEALALEQTKLQNKKIALTEVLGHLQDEKCNVKTQFYKNLEIAVLPILSRLKNKESGADKKLIDILETSLIKISNETFERHENVAVKLSPKELKVCILLKNGMSVKEIAQLYHLSDRTIEKHRENIRAKLNIKGTSINLVNYLRNMKFD